ncbi:uncharacterized protein [Montipora capricornis]|uniref:uncharacterized protein isoform X3 n=1 Tax=Montipora capricornis TaxID=246305 RepID=UPI0035F10438
MKTLFLSVVICFVLTVGLATPDNGEDITSQDEMLRNGVSDVESYSSERHPYLDIDDENSKEDGELDAFSIDDNERDREKEDHFNDDANDDDFEDDHDEEERVSDMNSDDNKIDDSDYDEDEEYNAQRLSDPIRFRGMNRKGKRIIRKGKRIIGKGKRIIRGGKRVVGRVIRGGKRIIRKGKRILKG